MGPKNESKVGKKSSTPSSVDPTGKKPFDKRKWRENKYSNKIKGMDKVRQILKIASQ